jgi:hypothetical protein
VSMLAGRDREIPGCESEGSASRWGRGGAAKSGWNGNRGAESQILRWVVEVQRVSGAKSKPTPIGSITGGL